MFERFGDLPLHVLVIHAAVVGIPGSALLGIVFAVVPKWRWLLRWPTLVAGVGAAVLAWLAKESGEAFLAAIPQLEPVVKLHEDRGDLLFWYAIVFAVLSIIAFFTLAGPSLLASGRGAVATRSRALEVVVSAAVVVMGLLVIWQTIRVGDAGAHAVWDGQLPKK